MGWKGPSGPSGPPGLDLNPLASTGHHRLLITSQNTIHNLNPDTEH